MDDKLETEVNNETIQGNEELNKIISDNEENIQDSTGSSEPSGAEIAKLNEVISNLEKEKNEFKEKFLRKMAEFDNYKRRTDLEQQNLLKYGGERTIMKLLPVVDDIERSILHINEATDIETFKQGFQLIFEKFTKFLNDQEIKKIECLGKPFDVNFHEALSQQPSKEYPPHTVIMEFQSGYMYKEKVIRHAQVIVSADNEDSPEVKATEQEETNR